jgi:hypothetical protein
MCTHTGPTFLIMFTVYVNRPKFSDYVYSVYTHMPNITDFVYSGTHTEPTFLILFTVVHTQTQHF